MGQPEPTSPAKPRKRIRWHRVRVYAWSILLILAMWFGATLITIRQHPERLVRDALAQLPFSSSTGRVFWQNRRTLEIDDVKLGDFFYADKIIVVASPIGLFRHHVAVIQVFGGQVFTKALYAVMDKLGSSGNAQGIDWTVGRLEIHRGILMLDNLLVATAIPVQLGMRQPIVLKGIKLGKPDLTPEMTEEQTVEIGNVHIESPFDPVAPVFIFPLSRVRFTYTELWHHQIREIDLIRPTLFLGEDLFWFSNEFKSEHTSAPTQGPAAPWQVGHFEVQYGQLAVNAFGQPVVHFPFYFETKVDQIRLDQLDKISAKSAITIQRLDQDYPDYKIQIVDLTGRLYFSLPPTDSTANNVVNTLSIEELAWNDIPVKGVNTTVTFDPNGVYGKINGACEGGQLTGNFEFYYGKGFAWNANFFADNINCQPIAEKLGGKYLDLTGKLNGKISVQGKITDILSCEGTLDLPEPGLLEIKSLDNLMKAADATGQLSLKDQATNIAVKAFRDYPYQRGELKIDYKPAGGVGTLRLDSPNGKRNFEINWHPHD